MLTLMMSVRETHCSRYGYITEISLCMMTAAVRYCESPRTLEFAYKQLAGGLQTFNWTHAWFPRYEGLFHMIALASLLIMG